MISAAIRANGLGKQYRRSWALRDCTLAVPDGHVVGLVGPNGAGKTTLLRLATGMLAPTRGTIEVLGGRPAGGPAELARVGFVAQDTPVYARMTVADHLRLGAWLNPGWDDDLARRRIGELDLDPKQRAGSLSGGQRAQLALTLAMAKRPELLILDEPVASLDPLARREFLRLLMEAVAEHGLSVVLSSHLVGDLERVCDYLIVLIASRVRIAGEVSGLLASHHRLSGPRRDPGTLPASQEVITESHTDKQSNLLIRTDGPVLDPAWTVTPVSLEDLVLAYLSRTSDDTRPVGNDSEWCHDPAQPASVPRPGHHRGISGCQPASCGHLASNWLSQLYSAGTYWVLYLLGVVIILLTPAILGLFRGAPLIARELETGTAALAWNQSITRTRWLAVKMILTGLAAMAITEGLSLIQAWWAAPIGQAVGHGGGGSNLAMGRFSSLVFATHGTTPLGYAAFGFALGVTAGQ